MVGAACRLLGLTTAGSPAGRISRCSRVLGALGLLVSAFARTEFRQLQFMPLIVLPQALLCGLFVARDQMIGWLQAISDAFPLTYAVEALTEVGTAPTRPR